MDEITSQKTITEKWLENLFNNLLRLETYEKLAKEGCTSILDYVDLNDKSLTQIQYKNYTLFLTEIEVVANDCKNLIKEEDYNKILFELSVLNVYEQKIGGFLDKKINEQERTSWFILKPEFSIAIKRISKLRRILVDNLWKLLSPIPLQEAIESSI